MLSRSKIAVFFPMYSMNKSAALFLGSLLVLSACGSKEKEVEIVEDKVLEVQKYNTVYQGSVDADHGKQVAFMYGSIDGVGESKANGVAYFPSFEDGASVLTVNVNILPAPEGSHYLVMLSDGSPRGLIEVGKLTSIVGDVRHSIKFATEEDIKSFNSILIYLMPNEGEGSQGLVAQGTMKPT